MTTLPAFKSGTVISFPKGGARRRASDMPIELMEYWDERIRADLAERRWRFDGDWKRHRAMIRNSDGGYLEGNLTADFVRLLHVRLLTRDLVINVTADDNMMVDTAEKAEIVAQSVARVAQLKEAMKEAIADAAWAPHGVMEFGHPLDPMSQDVMRSFRSPNLREPGEMDIADIWKEVNPEELSMFGVEATEIQTADPVMNNLDQGEDEFPQPIFNASLGYPWVSEVDPRLIIMPLNTRQPEHASYICRLRFLTAKELETVQNVRVDPSYANGSEYSDLFQEIEQDGDIKNFPEMLLVAEVWVKRDRNNPSYNNWYFSYLLGHPNTLIRSGPNHFGGMIPLVFTKLDRLKSMYDTTLAQELAPYAEIYALGVRAVKRDMLRMVNRPVIVGQGANLDPNMRTQLLNPNFRGIIEAGDVDQIKELFGDRRVDNDLLRSMSFIRSLAQARTNSSDLDQGTAIKDITARQVQAILDATGINVEGMIDEVSKMAQHSILKLMHLVGLYSMTIGNKRFNYGNRFTSFDRGMHDFVGSMIYDVQIEDSQEESTNEERMVWLQFLRTLQTIPEFKPEFSMSWLARATLTRFGESPRALATRNPAAGPVLDPSMLEGQPGFSPNVAGGLAPGQESAVRDMVQGQHPEREAGSRGLDLGNMMRGMQQIGTGSGE